jgi:hypothetical protein
MHILRIDGSSKFFGLGTCRRAPRSVIKEKQCSFISFFLVQTIKNSITMENQKKTRETTKNIGRIFWIS